MKSTCSRMARATSRPAALAGWLRRRLAGVKSGDSRQAVDQRAVEVDVGGVDEFPGGVDVDSNFRR